MRTHIYADIYALLCVFFYTYIYFSINWHIIDAALNIHVCACVCVYIYIYIYIYMGIYVYMCVYVYMYIIIILLFRLIAAWIA